MNSLTVSILLFTAAVICLVQVQSAKLTVGCLGPIPEVMSAAFTKCKVNLTPRSKRAAAKATMPPQQASKLTASEKTSAICVLNELKLINSEGINSTAVRRLMDHKANYAMGAKQVTLWRNIKQCGTKASDARREKEAEIDHFIACVENDYVKVCSS